MGDEGRLPRARRSASSDAGMDPARGRAVGEAAEAERPKAETMIDDWPEADLRIKHRIRALLAEGLPDEEIERRITEEFDLSPEEADRWAQDFVLAADPYFCPTPLSELPPAGTTEITFASKVFGRPDKRRRP